MGETTMERQTNIALTIDVAADLARYDECAKKLLSYDVIVAWILKSCTKEFSQYSVQFIMDNCLKEKPEISRRAVHQDQPDRDHELDGDSSIEKENSESTAIREQTIYYDIRFKAYVPGKDEPIILIINLEIQLDDTPGYPLVKRGFYYCARMISEQYGTIFTKEQYQDLCKVYSIWVCPSPAKKRENGILRYRTVEEVVYGESDVKQPDYDLMEVVVLNLGDASQKNNREILDLLNVLFSATTPPEEKKKILKNDFHIAMNEEFESEVQRMCDLSKGVYNEGVQQGLQQGEDMFAQLITKLFSLGRAGDAERAASDKEYRKMLMEEFQITK
jgi:hypothetical protein